MNIIKMYMNNVIILILAVRIREVRISEDTHRIWQYIVTSTVGTLPCFFMHTYGARDNVISI